MKEGNMSILLGAGFSYGARNKWEKELLIGTSLSNALYDQFYVTCPPKAKGIDYIRKVEDKKSSLIDICTILATEQRKDKRDHYLTNVFTGCHTVGDKAQEKLVLYPWRRIFTLNIDDLVEFIYKKAEIPLKKWNYSNQDCVKPEEPLLIKLHGDVQDEEAGYVFDKGEYSRYTVDNCSLLKEFSHCFLSSNMVLLGTEFQESDLNFILDTYRAAGYNDSGFDYFFVTPEIYDVGLLNEIEATKNFHWIPMKTDQFLNYITDHVIITEDKCRLLTEQGATFIDKVAKIPFYNSQLYSGKISEYNDFLGDWDVHYPNESQLVEKVTKQKESCIITLHGKPYTGKTVVSRRLLCDLSSRGFVAFELPRFNHDILYLTKEYLHTLAIESKVAILMEESAYLYDIILQFWADCPKLAQIVIITTDTTDNHLSRNHFLYNTKEPVCWIDFPISEKMTPDYIGQAFYTLCVHNRFNNFLTCIPENTSVLDTRSMDMVFEKMREINDIIDVLYFSSEGRFFKEHYAARLKTRESDFYYDYIFALCVLSKLGISRIPTMCLSRLIPNKVAKFSVSKLLVTYPDILEEQNGYIKLLRSRILSEVITTQDPTQVVNIITRLINFTVDLFDEDDGSIYYELFQKALRVKRIRNYSLLPHEHILHLFQSLEKSCNHISYFWVQYGLAAQLNGDFVNARNHFLYAQNIRPNSYQVRHALAKNKMELAYQDLLHGINGADELFSEGCNDMSELINLPEYAGAFSYSVHSYAYDLMKYYREKNEPIPENYCQELNDYFKCIIQSASRNGLIEKNLDKIIRSFISYCKSNKLQEYVADLQGVRKLKAIVTTDENSVEIHNFRS